MTTLPLTGSVLIGVMLFPMELRSLRVRQSPFRVCTKTLNAQINLSHLHGSYFHFTDALFFIKYTEACVDISDLTLR
jgi:hypothetical protein